jgi:RNA polymerase sigma factor (sigma-70 family)
MRLSSGGNEGDWREFLDDYWGPICGFAMRWGGLVVQDAEDVAAETFQTLIRSDLLVRWRENRAARLHTLLCAVARNVIANQARIEKGRKRIMREIARQAKDEIPDSIWTSPEASDEQVDAFYRAWVEDLLERSVERLLADLHRAGKGDYFRVLYGRLCEGLPMREIAEMLQIKTTTAENYFKAAKKRLAGDLEQAVRTHVEKYCDEASIDDEFRAEWARLSEYLLEHGGIENAVRSGHQRIVSDGRPTRKSKAFQDTAAILKAQHPSRDRRTESRGS